MSIVTGVYIFRENKIFKKITFVSVSPVLCITHDNP